MLDRNILQRLTTAFSSGFVLAFHDIQAERFADLIDGLGPFRAIHLSELVERSKQRKTTAGLFAITVDDGVGETVRTLVKILLRRSWPATFYIPTQYVGSSER